MMMVIDRVERRKKEADAVCQMIWKIHYFLILLFFDVHSFTRVYFDRVYESNLWFFYWINLDSFLVKNMIQNKQASPEETPAC